jgi:diguanylate cyclase (GGDEF)-like protein
MRGFVARIVDVCDRLFVPPRLRQDPARLREAQRAVAFHLSLLVWCPPFTFLASILGAPICSEILFWSALPAIGSLLLIRVTETPSNSGNTLCLVAWVTFTLLAIFSDGIRSPITPWYACLPVFALMLSGTRSGGFWTAASALTVTGLVTARHFGNLPATELTPHADEILSYSSFLAFLTVVSLMVWLSRDFEFRTQQSLLEANQCLAVEATTDQVTGISNRRYFDRLSEQEWKRHERTQLPLSIIIFDVDFFKQYNDAIGHAAGDRCLFAIAQAVHETLRRAGDFVARYGGEEFAAVLPNTGDRDAARIAEVIRNCVKDLKIPHPDSSLSPYVTVSVGSGTIIPMQTDSRREFVREVDRALYRAKACGRDRCVHVAAALVNV